MHESVMAWVGDMVAQLGLADKSVLEVGSYNVNGSVREFFTGPYLGIDREMGPGVDFVWDCEKPAHQLDWALRKEELDFALVTDIGQIGTMDVVVSTEALEHCVRPHLALRFMADALRRGGTLILTARGYGFPYHNPPDYLRYHPEAIRILMEDAGLEVMELCEDPQVPGVFALGRKP